MADINNDIYKWRRGHDKDDVELLTKLNQAIDGMYFLDGDIDYYCQRMNVSADYQKLIKEYFDENEMTDIAYKLCVVRTLLFGGKINYNILQEHLEKHLDEYGYVPKEN